MKAIAKLLIELRMAQITVDELHRKLEAVTTDELKLRHEEIPRDRDVILYRSCLNEESSGRATCCFAGGSNCFNMKRR